MGQMLSYTPQDAKSPATQPSSIDKQTLNKERGPEVGNMYGITALKSQQDDGLKFGPLGDLKEGMYIHVTSFALIGHQMLTYTLLDASLPDSRNSFIDNSQVQTVSLSLNLTVRGQETNIVIRCEDEDCYRSFTSKREYK
jgi:hypothetical protein